MITKIAHLADIHIRRSTDRHTEYKEVFDKTFKQLTQDKPDRIIIVGDLYNDYIEFQGEAMSLAAYFLNGLANIAPVRITRGNHDIRKKNLGRQDFIKTVIDLLNNDNIQYFENSDFYTDENVTWAVWHHPDKNGPYKADYVKIKGQTYIDLFHDPVYSSMSVNGYKMDKEHYIKLDAFEGHFGMFGDIHQRQFFGKKKNIAYCGSLIQQNYEESINGRGYLLWDISNGQVIENDIQNDYGYHVIEIGPNTDYENLTINPKDFSKYPRIKIKWTEHQAQINKFNEIKIRELISNLNPIEILFEKFPLDISMTTVAEAELSNINDPVVQQQIFLEYLNMQNWPEAEIQEILKIDQEINNRLKTNTKMGTNWKLVQMWMDNFKSYGDNNFLDFDNNKGLLQITGLNEQGKTTILDAICYLLYGKTLATVKKEKHGDARFINNKRDLLYCKVGGILEINSKYYLIVRRTDIALNKKQEIKDCTSLLKIYDIPVWNGIINYEDLNLNDELTGERLLNTQNLFSDFLGEFEDFIRNTLTNADNLNDLLSVDRAKFIDAINRDAGLDIFEKKLEEFKSYKKALDLTSERLVVDIVEEETKKETLQTNILNTETQIADNVEKIKINLENITKCRSLKDEELKKFKIIDEKLKEINLVSVKDDIEKEELYINKLQQDIQSINLDINKLPKEFNTNLLKEVLLTINDQNKELENLKVKVLENNQEIKNFENDKKALNIEFQNTLNLKKENLKNEISKATLELNHLQEKLETLKKDASNLKIEMTELENSKTCTQCNRLLEEEHIQHVKTKIDTIAEKLKVLKEDYLNKSVDKDIKIKDLEVLKNKNIETDSEILSLKKILEDNLHVLENSILKINDKNTLLTLEAKKLKDNILIQENLKNKHLNDQKEFFKKSELEKNIVDKNLKIEQTKNKILILQNTIKEIEKIQNDLLHNQELQKNIDVFEKDIQLLEDEINKLKDIKINLDNKINSYKKEISDINSLIERYILQIQRDKLLKAYVDCVHRDGIPTMLLKKFIGNINATLAAMLEGQSFVTYFDENLILKLSHVSKLEAQQNAIESSGKERTFMALALKMALRQINNRSKANFMMFDEIMGKLIENSVQQFMVLLDKIKLQIENIMIIEHVHPIDFDHQIEVSKDAYGVSTLTFS